MAVPWHVEAKLRAPIPPDGWLARSFEPTTAPATLLVAGPGYGKTLAMLALWQRTDARLRLWYGLDADDADPANLVPHLVTAMRAHVPDFGRDLLSLSAPDAAWRGFLAELAAYNVGKLVIALDDVHHLFDAGPAAFAAIVDQLDRLPPGVTLLMTSRRRPPVALARARARGRLALIDQPRLRFDASEQTAFLASRHAEPGALQGRAEPLEGWPLGLELLAAGGEVAGEGLSAYVAEELVDAQPPARRDFMLRAALLPELTPDACRAVLADDAAHDHLQALEAEHLVVRLAEGGGFRFPAYLREHLDERARFLPDRAKLQARAARHAIASDRPDVALPHLIAGGAWDDAIRAARRCFPTWVVSGRHALLERTLAAFPAMVVDAEPELLVWQGHVLARAARPDEALERYRRARALFAAHDDMAGELTALARECKIVLLRDDRKAARLLLMQAQGLQESGRAADVADLHLLLALDAERRGDLALVAEYNQAVLAISVGQDVEVADTQCVALLNLFTLALQRGDMLAARQNAVRAVALAEAWGFAPYRLYASFLLADLCLLEGDREGQEAFFKGLPADWEAWLDWHDAGCAWAILGSHHAFHERWREAEAAFGHSIEVFERGGFPEGTLVGLERLLWLAVRRKQYARVADLAARAEGLDGENVHRLAILTPRARALQLGGDAGAAAALLREAVAASDRVDARLHGTRARLYLAAAELAAGDATAARRALAEATAAIERHGYDFLLAQDQRLWEELGPLARREHGEGARVSVSVVEEAPVPTAPAPAPAASGEVPPLVLRLFGPMEVRVGGVLLDEWRRKKAKLVLAALALYPNGLDPDELIQLCGGEDTVESLRVNVMTLRKALERDPDQRKASRYVTHVRDRYALAPEALADLDLATFERGLREGDRLAADRPGEAAAAYERALEAYRGTLLDERQFLALFESTREGLRQRALASLLWLAAFHAGRGDASAAEVRLTRATKVAATEPAPYLALMRHYQAHGRPERVRQVYWDCRKAFKAELGLEPGDEFEAAYAAIARG